MHANPAVVCFIVVLFLYYPEDGSIVGGVKEGGCLSERFLNLPFGLLKGEVGNITFDKGCERFYSLEKSRAIVLYSIDYFAEVFVVDGDEHLTIKVD